jgi:hypothetical protein
MFAIEAVNEKGWRWISAICLERRAAEAFLASVSPGLRPIQRLRQVAKAGKRSRFDSCQPPSHQG